MNCEIKKGIFVLHTCNAKAFVQCSVCRRSVCPAHIDKSSGSRIVCVECAAKEYQQNANTAKGKKTPATLRNIDVLDDFWYYSTRNHFYTTYQHYKPFTAKEQEEFEKVTENELDSGDLSQEASSFLDS
jgi:hypothetical protein